MEYRPYLLVLTFQVFFYYLFLCFYSLLWWFYFNWCASLLAIPASVPPDLCSLHSCRAFFYTDLPDAGFTDDQHLLAFSLTYVVQSFFFHAVSSCILVWFLLDLCCLSTIVLLDLIIFLSNRSYYRFTFWMSVKIWNHAVFTNPFNHT